MPISFLKNWTIDHSKIQQYAPFRGTFHMQLDYTLLCQMYSYDHSEFTSERKAMLRPILETINKATGVLDVKHNNRFGLGRFYADNSISPINISRHMKHTLFSYLDWVDIDMIKGHASILYEIAKNNSIMLPTFKTYIDNFEGISTMLVNYYNVTEQVCIDAANVKNLFNLMIYGGGVNNWFETLQTEGVVFRTVEVHPFIIDFKAECSKVISLVYLSNSKIVDTIKGTETDEYRLKNKTMSYFCQTIENEILYVACKVLLSRDVIQPKAYALEYDGICFKKPDSSIDLNQALDEVNTAILSKTGLNVFMKYKTYEDKYVHYDLIDQRNIPVALLVDQPPIIAIPEIKRTLSECETYLQFKHVFELTHFKCRGTASYYKEDTSISSDGSIGLTSYTEHAMKTAYRDFNYEVQTKNRTVKKYYIDEWFDDTRMRVYESLRCVPPPLICPDNVYNTWKPFKVETLTALEKDQFGKCIIPEADKVELETKYEFICNHIRAMTGHDPIAYDYLMSWFGYLFLAPAEKSNMPSIIGPPGCGKTEMLNFPIALIGEARCLVTSKPQDDVWGQYNSLISEIYLVILEELSEKQTAEYEGIIKDLITGKRLNINTKGVKQYKIDSYLKMVAISNTITYNTTVGDRRNVMIKSSSEYINNIEYFTKLREYQADQRVQMIFYERLLEIPGLSAFRTRELPVTLYQQTLQNGNRDSPDLFIEHWISKCSDIEPVVVASSKLYKLYIAWHVENNGASIKVETHAKFMRNLSLFLGPLLDTTITDKSLRTSKGNTLRLHVEGLRAKYNVSRCTEDINEVEEGCV